MRSLAAIAFVVAAGAAGLLAARAAGSGGMDAETQELLRRLAQRADRPASASAPAVYAASPAAVDIEVLRKLIREAMEQERAATPEPAPRDEPPPVPEVLRARADGQSLVDGALAAGRWTAEDRDALGKLVPALGEAGMKELLTVLIPAMNAQKIRVEVMGPIF
jgi:hypothetical protein